ncbi:exonuclease SbcCD subunit D [Kushneria phosphatilytica]|uniref:Nuclease SbcCD subunit D n=1 Tax=Kushneria phosphatilytica TaxID=657387 RepID=A0A1S1NXJ5_9GAMM|nr:exonuclease SbcCD subunit D C-terminal domain-containing protein [Kushneria phosphatilytica]OHV12188.1 exonuclease SbcCD subunit D [Kushneria phosphatilytica]QEL11381.1 exonuclease subunit SbcD [Kushneria phosphatilytica]
MKLIHTADWHLGQQLHNQPRDEEHSRFLDWLLETLIERQPDALLIAGDIFDVVNPSLSSQTLLYDFLVRAHEALPRLTIVMIAGNHDSGARIELPAPLLERLRTHAIGRLHWLDEDTPDSQRLVIPLEDASGKIAARCLAIPFLRPSEISARYRTSEAGFDAEHAYVEGISRLHRDLITAAERELEPGQALIVMSHAHLHGASVSEHSERPIVIGGEESLSASLFGDTASYVALGHLHRPQRVGAEHIRYAGSPIPLDFSERHYPHQLIEVTLEDKRMVHHESLAIPRFIELRRIGPASLDTVLAELEELPAASDTPGENEQWPWLEVRVRLDAPCVDLRARIERVLNARAARLMCIHVERPTVRPETSDPIRQTPDPRTLFSDTWQQHHNTLPDEQTLADFDELYQTVLDHPEGNESS